MTLEEAILEKARALSPEKRYELLSFAERLQADTPPNTARKPLRGLWKDLGIKITEEDIAEARREMWGNFPRNDI